MRRMTSDSGCSFLSLPEHLDTVHAARHLDVEQNDIEKLIFQHLDGLFATGDTDSLEFAFLQTVDNGFQEIDLVVYDQNSEGDHFYFSLVCGRIFNATAVCFFFSIRLPLPLGYFFSGSVIGSRMTKVVPSFSRLVNVSFPPIFSMMP